MVVRILNVSVVHSAQNSSAATSSAQSSLSSSSRSGRPSPSARPRSRSCSHSWYSRTVDLGVVFHLARLLELGVDLLERPHLAACSQFWRLISDNRQRLHHLGVVLL